ncbi:aminotransferase class V [Ignisphaera aggregans DSM 17230]|uniref:cysteine desulfurase n=1 Tax=Ignisphaera aggregans (strain DSM 17230 / JCM 13409 / AQ1.S1) TaxID=583356 RepID=E0SQ23_IGNAA|nr:aminotransferase class V [Ignisphaera aggregans DSM 17230]
MSFSKKIRELLDHHGKPSKEVYFDLENSGWVPPEVVEAMKPYYNVYGYGHPSITHRIGWEALEVVYEAKELIASSIGAKSIDEIVFTHSGTEANNLAIAGYLLANRNKRGKVIVSSIEHLSVIFPAEFYANILGFKVIRVPVNGEGFIDPEIFKYYVDRDTVLISIQMVNHEIGTVQNIRELVDIAKSVNPNIVFHTDAADAYGKMAIDVNKLGVDMMTISSHKIHGPRGVGVLYVREGINLESPIRGQLSVEKLWPGVENVPAIAGFKKAIELAFNDFDYNINHMKRLRDKLMKGIMDNVDDVLINGPIGDRRAPDNLNISFLYVEGEAITVELSLHGIYVSSGSACTSRVLEPSHVLLAIGRKHEEAHGSILFKTSRYHSEDDIDYAIEIIPKAIDRLRSISSIKPNR